MQKTLSIVPDAAVVRGVATGSKFKLFVQPKYVDGFQEPETIIVSVPGGRIRAGPSDNRMYVVDALNKKPYDSSSHPPYNGRRNPPLQPDIHGNFDTLNPDSREFSAATMYATVRRVLDIWEGYFGGEIGWVFQEDYKRMELIPLVNWDNAHSGWGFLEFGYANTTKNIPFCQNFDVLAHELGHNILYSKIGFPAENSPDEEFWGFHESSGDLIAMISSLHFNKMVDHLLLQTQGNLYSQNELGRLGELSRSSQIRNASNNYTMKNYPGYPGKEEHDLSVPLTGGIFDILVEVYQKKLVELGAISEELAERSFHQKPGLASEFKQAYATNPASFKTALLEARDYLGDLLAHCWSSLKPDNFTYSYYAKQLLASDKILGGLHQDTIRTCLSWRKIQIPLSRRNVSHRVCAMFNQEQVDRSKKESLIESIVQLRNEVVSLHASIEVQGSALQEEEKSFVQGCHKVRDLLIQAEEIMKNIHQVS